MIIKTRNITKKGSGRSTKRSLEVVDAVEEIVEMEPKTYFYRFQLCE
jgi:hypothetical protein